jgi:glycopeptide antibiotics resistance protein
MKWINNQYIKGLTKVASVLYFILVGYVTLFSRRRELTDRNYRDNVNLDFMSKATSYSDLDDAGKFYFIQDILGNAILFLPFASALFYLASKKRNNLQLIIIMLLSTLIIESSQFVFDIGVFDIDDIVLNLTGGIVGMFLFNFIYTKYAV